MVLTRERELVGQLRVAGVRYRVSRRLSVEICDCIDDAVELFNRGHPAARQIAGMYSESLRMISRFGQDYLFNKSNMEAIRNVTGILETLSDGENLVAA